MLLETKSEVLSIQEVALILGVSTQTLRRWDKQGILKAFRVKQTQPRRYQKEEIIKFINTSPKNNE